MEKTHIYAMTVVIGLGLALAFTLQSDPLEIEAQHVDTRVVPLTVGPVDQGRPQFIFGTAEETVFFSESEAELIEVAMDTYLASTTTTHAQKRSSRLPAPTTTSPATPTTTASPELRASYESEFVSRINSYRSSKGLSTLTRHGALDSRARDWAKYMATKSKPGLVHSNLQSLVPPWLGAGENLAIGYQVGSIFSSLVNSSAHRAIMLGDYTHVGVGVWVDGNGAIWTVHVFAKE